MIRSQFKYLVLLTLLYAPWHDAYTLGQRGHISLFGHSIVIASLVNLFFVVSYIFFLIPQIAKKNKKLVAFLFFITLQGMFSLSDKGVVFGNPMTSIHFVLVSLGLMSLWSFETILLFPTKVYLLGLLASYSLSLVLPALISIPGYDPTVYLTPIYRYRGWTGEGQPVAWMGLQLLILGTVCSVVFIHDKKIRLWSLIASSIGIVGIYLNVLRTSAFLGIAFLLGTFVWMRAEHVRTKYLWIRACANIVAIVVILSTGQFLLKSKRNCYDGTVFQTSLTKITEVKKVEDIEKVIVTNGRARTLRLLFEAQKVNWLFGNGSGWTQAYLKNKEAGVLEPNNDYVRILFDWGILGLGFFLYLFFLSFYKSQASMRVVLFIFSLALLTDAILIIPTFGYLMFFAQLWILKYEIKKVQI